MQDSKIFPGQYAYQFRLDILNSCNARIIAPDSSPVDILHCKAKYKNEIYLYSSKTNLFLKNFTNYLIHLEIGEKTKKLHYQGILWSKNKYNNIYINNLKARHFNTNRIVKNSVSLTSAKKITNLASYISKQNVVMHSTLTANQVALIPSWKKRETDKQFKEKFQHQLRIWCAQELPVNEVISNMTQYYWDNKRCQLSKSQTYKYLGWYHPNYSAKDHTCLHFSNDFQYI